MQSITTRICGILALVYFAVVTVGVRAADPAVAAPRPSTAPATPSTRPVAVPLRPYPAQRPEPAKPIDFKVTTIDGVVHDLRAYDGYVIVFVNVASNCGLTPQYSGLQRLYDRYHDHKFIVLAFPANDFLHQEPGTDAVIRKFATERYGVTFPMMSKIVVKGQNQHPLYAFLTAKETGGAFAGDVDWNFAKFLVGREGKVVGRFPAKVTPTDPKVLAAIETALGLTPEQVAALPPLPKPATRPATSPATPSSGS